MTRKHERRERQAERCEHCGAPLPPDLRSHARYCGDACRATARQAGTDRAHAAQDKRVRRAAKLAGLTVQHPRGQDVYQLVDSDGAIIAAGLTLDETEARLVTRSESTPTALRAALDIARAETGARLLDEVTVLAKDNDPFRTDVPAKWRDARWFAEQVDELFPGRRVHLRGLHYAVLGRARPDGPIYVSDDDSAKWLGFAAKAARWLGTVPFERIVDHRNAAPVIFEHADRTPAPWIGVETTLDEIDVDDFRPTLYLPEVEIQPYRLVIWSEKSSTEDVLAPIAERYRADLYLGTGEASDTLIHKMAGDADDDGRPVVILTVTDADPAGWQMPISIARKLQAFKVALFPELQFRVRRVALTPEQVRDYDLPSTPLKPKERRASKWRAEMGIEQTEIDALATLRPEVLAELIEQAIAPFYDAAAEAAASETRRRWHAAAQVSLNESINADEAARLRAEVEDALDELRELERQAAELTDLTVDDLDPVELPVAEPTGADDELTVIDSDWSFGEQTERLIAQKRYDADDNDGAAA